MFWFLFMYIVRYDVDVCSIHVYMQIGLHGAMGVCVCARVYIYQDPTPTGAATAPNTIC